MEKNRNNNLASTVFYLFLNGVSKYGLPKKIRTDHWLENVYAARYMFSKEVQIVAVYLLEGQCIM